MTRRRLFRFGLPVLVVLLAAGAWAGWRLTRHSEELPYWLVYRGQTNYVNGEYDYGDPITDGCVTARRIDALGLWPLRRIGVIGTEDLMPPNADAAGTDASPIVSRGPGDEVFAAAGNGSFIGSSVRLWRTLFVAESPGCLVEFPIAPA